MRFRPLLIVAGIVLIGIAVVGTPGDKVTPRSLLLAVPLVAGIALILFGLGRLKRR